MRGQAALVPADAAVAAADATGAGAADLEARLALAEQVAAPLHKTALALAAVGRA